MDKEETNKVVEALQRIHTEVFSKVNDSINKLLKKNKDIKFYQLEEPVNVRHTRIDNPEVFHFMSSARIMGFKRVSANSDRYQFYFATFASGSVGHEDSPQKTGVLFIEQVDTIALLKIYEQLENKTFTGHHGSSGLNGW